MNDVKSEQLNNNCQMATMSKNKLTDGNLISDVVERIEELRLKIGDNKKKFCERIGFNTPLYSQITGSRGTKPNLELISAIANKLPNANIQWVLTGNGSGFKDGIESNEPDTTPENSDIVRILEKQVEELREDKSELRERNKTIESEKKMLLAKVTQLTDDFFQEKTRLFERIDELKRELDALSEGKNTA